MKQIFFVVLLLLACSLVAQDYRPFQPGKLHYFTSASNYSVRIDSVDEVNGDSTYWMNEIAIPPPPACTIHISGNYFQTPHFIQGYEGFFVDRFIRRANGAFQFVNREGDTATFHTTVPIGTTWTFLSDSNLTAAITSRTHISVAGTLDSVIVIDISDGHQYQLSENFGLVQGPNLSHYMNDDILRSATVAYLPVTPDWKTFFGWQPADVYLTLFHVNAQSGYEYYDLREVLTRTVSPNQDSIRFTFSCQRYQIWYPGTPTMLSSFQDSIIYTQAELGGLEKATYEVHFGPWNFHFQQAWTNSFNNRLVLPFKYNAADGWADSCGFVSNVLPECNKSFPEHWTSGLGNTFRISPHGFTTSYCIDATFQMLCYEQAGQDSSGDCASMFHTVPADDPLEDASVTLYHEFGSRDYGLRWERMPVGTYRWELYDLGGKRLWEKEVFMQENGSQRLDAEVPNGIYVLRIVAQDTDWERRLKVPLLSE